MEYSTNLANHFSGIILYPSRKRQAPLSLGFCGVKDRTSQFVSLSLDEAWAIDAMINGANFGEICEGLCQWVDEKMQGSTLHLY